MSAYRAAKAAEHTANLQWLRAQLSSFRTAGLPHDIILQRLEEKVDEAEKGLILLKTAVQIAGLEADADALSSGLAKFVRTTSDYYVAGLRHQSTEELATRDLLLKVCSRLHLDWIHDALVRYSRDLALLPVYHGDYSIPILFAPPNLMEGVLTLPGIHHELGHSVFARDRQFVRELGRVVDKFFDDEKKKLGPLAPKKRSEQEAAFDAAARYWSESQLAEVFCDVFAGYVCGPGNLISVTDLHLAEGPNPYLISNTMHPPGAARVSMCERALSPMQRGHALVRDTLGDWHNFVAKSTPDASYQRCCPPALLQILADRVNELIATHLPAVPRYTKPLTTLDEARVIPTQLPLEDAINAGHVVLLASPTEFPSWWKSAGAVLC